MATDSAGVPPVLGAPAVVSGPLTSAFTGDSVRPVARTPQGHIRKTFPEAAGAMGVSVHEGVVPLRDPMAGDDAGLAARRGHRARRGDCRDRRTDRTGRMKERWPRWHSP